MRVQRRFSYGRPALHPRQFRNRREALPEGRPAHHLRLVAGAHAQRRPRPALGVDRGRIPRMRIAVVHTTRYRYGSPVYLEPHIIRLRPREDASQRPEAWTLDIAPTPLGRTECLDQDGNSVVRAWFDSLTAELSLRSQFNLETLRDKDRKSTRL